MDPTMMNGFTDELEKIAMRSPRQLFNAFKKSGKMKRIGSVSRAVVRTGLKRFATKAKGISRSLASPEKRKILGAKLGRSLRSTFKI